MTQNDINAINEYIAKLQEEYGKDGIFIVIPYLGNPAKVIPDEIKLVGDTLIKIKGHYRAKKGFVEALLPRSNYVLNLEVVPKFNPNSLT